MLRFFLKKWSNKPINRKKNNENKDIIDNKNNNIKKNIIEPEKKIMLLDNIKTIEELNYYVKHNIEYSSKQVSQISLFLGNIENKILILNESGNINNNLINLLNNLKIDINKCIILNSIFWKVPFDRKPNNEEFEICKPVILKFIEILQPNIILTLGSISSNILFPNTNLLIIRGSILEYNNIPVISTFHPNYVENLIKQKNIMIDDLNLFKLELFKRSLLNN